MSKTLLNLIKPLHHPKPRPTSSSPIPLTSNLKYLVKDAVRILRNDPEWQESLESRFYGEDTEASEVAHFLFDQIRDPELGLKFFDWASKRSGCGASLNGVACSSLLKLLARCRVFGELECLLELMKGKGLIPTREAWSVVVSAYADSGLVTKAVEMYRVGLGDYNCVPDVFACNSLLYALVEAKKVRVAKDIFDDLVQRDVAVDNYSVGITVSGLCREGKIEEGMKLIEMRWGKGCLPNVVFYNILIDGCWKKCDAKMANVLFRELKLKGFLPTVETYGTMINGFCKQGNFEAVDNLLLEMKQRGLNLNARICNTIVDARIKHGGKLDASDMFNWMSENGCKPDTTTYNIFINGLCKKGKLNEAEQLLEEAVRKGLPPSKYSYTPLVELHCKHGNHVRASSLLIEMTERGHTPDLVAFGALVLGLVTSGEVDVALKVKNKMVEKGVWPDSNVYNVLMSGLSKKGRLHDVKLLCLEMLDHNVAPDSFVIATMVDCYTRNGEFDEAKKLFELTIDKGMDCSTVGYNAMIKGFCKSGNMKDAISCMKSMIRWNHSPDEFTYSTIIDGYVKQNDMHAALEMFEQMRKEKCKPNVITYTSLIDGFCRIGDLSGAEKTLKEMVSVGLEPNVVTYTILIRCFCKLGKHAKACSLFELMLQNQCSPNYITLKCLLNELTNNAPVTASFMPESASEETENTKFLEFLKIMIADGWDGGTAAYNYILICLCQHNMVETALWFCDEMRRRGLLPDPVSYAAILHGLCLEGRSHQWRDFISCKLTECELEIAVRYSQKLTNFLPQELEPEALHILQNLLKDCMNQSKILMQ